MCEIRYIIIAKQCEVTGTSSILDGCLKKSSKKDFLDAHLISPIFLASRLLQGLNFKIMDAKEWGQGEKKGFLKG